MAEIATIARPYAQALYRVAQTKNSDAWSNFVFELAQISAHAEIQALAHHPKVDVQQLADCVLDLLKSPVDEDAKRFITLLTHNHRLTLMPEIADQFSALKNAAQGIGEAHISSAFPLEEKQLTELLATLEKKFGKSLKANVAIDPSLIGGICVRVGDEVLDTSVRARLNHMHASLTT